jgi:hypothetical protein
MSDETGKTKYYTTWGSVTGDCGHLHRSPEAAGACLDQHGHDCRTQGGRSDRQVRVVRSREELDNYDVTRGPGDLFDWLGYPGPDEVPPGDVPPTSEGCDIRTVLLTPDRNRPLVGVRITTAHSASSYGIPVLLIDGEPTGPHDYFPGTVLLIPAGAEQGAEAVAALIKGGHQARLEYLSNPEALRKQYAEEMAKFAE